MLKSNELPNRVSCDRCSRVISTKATVLTYSWVKQTAPDGSTMNEWIYCTQCTRRIPSRHKDRNKFTVPTP